MKIKSGYKIRNIAGESVIVSIGQLNVNLTKVISLNPTSVWLWERLGQDDFDAAKVASLLVDNYEVDHERALADAQDWIATLTKAGLTEE